MARKYQSKGSLRSDAAAPLVRSLTFDLAFEANHAAEVSGVVNVVGTDLSPYSLDISRVPATRVALIRVQSGGPFKLFVTSTAGTRQAIPLDDLWFVNYGQTADAITALELSGTGVVEFMAAGDLDTVIVPPPPPVPTESNVPTKKASAGTLAVGTPVYNAGGYVSGYLLVEAAQFGVTPEAVGIISTASDNVTGGTMVSAGIIQGALGVVGLANGTQLYLSPYTAGAFTTRDGDGRQKLGVVAGSGIVLVEVETNPVSANANYPQTFLQQRYYFIDPIAGDDTNAGFLDGALDATFTSGQRVGIPLRTYDEFLLRLDKNQTGRKIVLLVAPMADGSVLLNKVGAPQNMDVVGFFGTTKFQIRGSDLSNDLTDKTFCPSMPFEAPVGDPSGDGSWTMTGSGSGYFDVAVAPTQACLGKRVRSATGTTYGTAATFTTIRAIVGTRVYVRGTLTPVIGERVWIERPKVRFNRCNIASAMLEDVPPNVSTPAADALTFVGLDFASDMRVRGVRGVHRLSFVTLVGSLSWLRGDQLLATTVWIDQDVTGAYTNRTSGAGFTQVGSTCTVSVCAAMNLQASAITAAMSFSTIARFNIQFGSALRGTVSLVGVGAGAGLGSSAAGNSFIGDNSVFPTCAGQITVRESSISFLNVEVLNNTAAFININAKGSVITLDGLTSPYGGNTDVILDLTNSAGSTAICGRSVANTAVGSLGAIRQFGGNLIATFALLVGREIYDGARNKIQGSGWIADVPDLADWAPTLTRYYFVNNTSGDDTRAGFIDAAHGFVWPDATAGNAVALRTLEEVWRRIPRCGNGRRLKILVLGNAAASSTYKMLNKAGVQDSIDIRGFTPLSWDWFGMQVSDFTNSNNDRTDFARRIALPGPNGDGSWTVSAYSGGTVTIGGATPLTLGSALCGRTLRWKGNVTAGLRNRTLSIVEVLTTTTAVLNASTSAGGFPAPGDEFFIERPSVNVGFVYGAWGDMSASRTTAFGAVEFGSPLCGFEINPDVADVRAVFLASSPLQSCDIVWNHPSGFTISTLLSGWCWNAPYIDEASNLWLTRGCIRIDSVGGVTFSGAGDQAIQGGSNYIARWACTGPATVSSVTNLAQFGSNAIAFGRVQFIASSGPVRMEDGRAVGGGTALAALRIRNSTTVGALIRGCAMSMAGMDISGSTSHAIELLGTNTIELDLVSGASNGGHGISLASAVESKLLLRTSVSVTGTLGDILTSGGRLSYAQLAWLDFKDLSNTILATTVGEESTRGVRCIASTAVALGDTIRLTASATGVPAQANLAANATDVIGCAQNAAGVGEPFMVVGTGVGLMLFGATPTVPPSTAWLDPAVAGQAVMTAPAVTGNQRLRLAKVLRPIAGQPYAVAQIRPEFEPITV